MAGGETTSLLVLILIALPVLVFAIQSLRTEPSGKEGREYKEGDYIPLFANIVYPEDSDRGPCEGYSYFDLPFCPPGDPIPNRKKSFQELISGNCYVNTGYDIRFKMNAEGKLLCEKTLTREEVAKFRDAAENYARYEMYIDNILIKERVGMCKDAKGNNGVKKEKNQDKSTDKKQSICSRNSASAVNDSSHST